MDWVSGLCGQDRLGGQCWYVDMLHKLSTLLTEKTSLWGMDHWTISVD
jgi:hypothetical protein